jgi:hypothetical protein
MLKKMMLLAMAVGAIAAFAAPAMAQASVELSDSEGTLPIGAEVTATSHNLVTFSPVLGTLTCERVTIHGDVTENGESSIHIEETNTETEGCSPAPITIAESGDITIEEGGTGLAEESLFQVAGACNFEGSPGFAYETNTDEIEIAGEFQFNGNCGPGDMSGNFTLETSDGSPITIT